MLLFRWSRTFVPMANVVVTQCSKSGFEMSAWGKTGFGDETGESALGTPT
jgi:hypothetical protein